MKELVLDGVHIAVEKKSIKNMYLRVHPANGRVLLSAPTRMPDAQIERFARQRLPWIQKHLASATLCQATPPCCETGQIVPLFGRPMPLTVVPHAGRMQVQLCNDGILLLAQKNSTPEKRAAALTVFLREQLAAAAERTLPCLEQRVGKRASALRIRNMTSRWGTCNTTTGVVTINFQLVSRAPEFLDYILVHELTHLLEPSHNAHFYALMDRFYPGWKQVRKQLKSGGIPKAPIAPIDPGTHEENLF